MVGHIQLVLSHLDVLLGEFEKLQRQLRSNMYDESDIHSFVTSVMAAVERATGSNSPYTRELENGFKVYTAPYHSGRVNVAGGVLKSVRDAVANDYLVTVQELIHSSVFANFIEMAEHLLTGGYKDPAAVLTGGVLEEHLRNLALKNGLDIDYVDNAGDTRLKTAERLNNDLKTANVYPSLEHKNVVSWLELRNKAAHGRYGEYDAAHVDLLLRGVRDFLVRYPA